MSVRVAVALTIGALLLSSSPFLLPLTWSPTRHVLQLPLILGRWETQAAESGERGGERQTDAGQSQYSSSITKGTGEGARGNRARYSEGTNKCKTCQARNNAARIRSRVPIRRDPKQSSEMPRVPRVENKGSALCPIPGCLLPVVRPTKQRKNEIPPPPPSSTREKGSRIRVSEMVRFWCGARRHVCLPSPLQ